MIDYQKIIIAVLENFIGEEGTDHLQHRTRPETTQNFPTLNAEELAELTRLRDQARANMRWLDYEKKT